MADKIKQKRGTESSWIAANPTLDSGEIGFITDTNEIVIGDGSTPFSSLTRIEDTSRLTGHIGSTDEHPLVTTSSNGFMSSSDKQFLDSHNDGSNNLTLDGGGA
jgi:hypothetical protein